ncbi:beta strand repeat-containing protein [Halovivax limisalsi]|uniref:beta strand repeat-containing protein n=1 Tax=Halovivax limisalsi TaxID=1453760 RepID=UPI001FFC475E|nr:carboxypeptidase regulatory-like domain-containing protein [Halovivax limisalsi]
MHSNTPTPRTPTAAARRAIILSILVVLSTVATTGFVALPVAAASGDPADVTLGSTDPGAMTAHNWSLSADSAGGENLGRLSLDYAGTNTNLSAVEPNDVAVTVGGSSVTVNDVFDYNGNETLDVWVTATQVAGGDNVTVEFRNDVVENPSSDGEYVAWMDLFDDGGGLITSGSSSFTIGSGDEGGTGTIAGQVTNASDGTGIGGAEVYVTQGGGLVNSTVADSNGNYSVSVPTGTYNASAAADGYDANTTQDVGVTDSATTRVDLALAESTEDVSDPASVTLGNAEKGVLTAHNWSMSALSASGENLTQIDLSYLGTGVNLSRVAPGDVAVSVNGTPATVHDVLDTGSAENASISLGNDVILESEHEVSVNFLADVVENPPANGTYTGYIDLMGNQSVGRITGGSADFTIGSDGGGSNTGTIEGRVTNATDGTPIGGATVDVYGAEYATTTTDSGGNYSLDVAPGTYDVFVSHVDYDDNSTNGVGVTDGGTTTVDVALTKPSFKIVDTSVEWVGGTEPSMMPTVSTYRTNLAGVNLVGESGQDLASIGVETDTVFRVNATFEDFTPRQMIGTMHDASWEYVNVTGKQVTVSVVGKPGSAQYMNNAPGLHEWPDDGTDQADVEFEQMWDFAFDEMDYVGMSESEKAQVNGSILATDAQTFSMPQYDEGTSDQPGSLSIDIAGPHLTVGGKTNYGFFEGFVTDAQLAAWNVSDPTTELIANYQGSGVTGMNVTAVDGGARYEFPVHYSAGTVSVSAGEQQGSANFDVAIDSTNAPVEAGSALSVDVTVTNTGAAAGTKDVGLLDLSGSSVDSETITLESGASTTITLTWSTGDGDAGSGSITVTSTDDSASVDVTIEEPSSGGGPALPPPPPSEPDLSVVGIDAAATTVAPGEEISVTVTVANDGDAAGTQSLELTVDGTVVASASVDVAAGATVVETVSYTFESAGSYALAINGQSAGTVTVEESAADGDSKAADPDETEGGDDTDSGSDQQGAGSGPTASTDPDSTSAGDPGPGADGVPGFTPIVTIVALLSVLAARRRRTG